MVKFCWVFAHPVPIRILCVVRYKEVYNDYKVYENKEYKNKDHKDNDYKEYKNMDVYIRIILYLSYKNDYIPALSI